MGKFHLVCGLALGVFGPGCGLTLELAPDPGDAGSNDGALRDARMRDAPMSDATRDASDIECTGESDCPNDGCRIYECDPETRTCQHRGAIACAADECHVVVGCDDAGCIYELVADADGDGFAPRSLGECGLDCNDLDGDLFPGALEECDGEDQDCDGVIDEHSPGSIVCGADLDADGNGSSDDFRWECAGVCPDGYVPGNDDCWDDIDPMIAGVPGPWLARPGQRTFFSQPRGDGTDSFDWNCDMVVEGNQTEMLFVSCDESPECGRQSGWEGEVPVCGERAGYTECVDSVEGCLAIDAMRTMSCR